MVFASCSRPDEVLKRHNIVRIDVPLLIDLLDEGHELVKLTGAMDWPAFDKRFEGFFKGERGRPPVKTRVIVALLYLKHVYNLSDDDVIARTRENVYWQYFCGNEFFERRDICDATSLVRWRKRMGEEGTEFLLQKTLECALKMKAIKVSDLDDVIIDTTVQEKNVSFPTDAKLLNRARSAVVTLAGEHGVELRQNYNRESKHLVVKSARYSHAKQFKRSRRCRKRLTTILGRVLRDFSRKADESKLKDNEKSRLSIARRIYMQMLTGKDKIYSFHAPETECISKGKAHKRYEFGCKVSIATTCRSNWIIGAKAMHGRPYDGHTLDSALMQIKNLVGKYPSNVYVDKGYKGSIPPNPDETRRFISGQKRGVKGVIKQKLRRRSAVEPVIGHLKRGHRLGRNFLKGVSGDQINVILAAAGSNLSKLLAVLFFKDFLNTFLSNFMT
jgi:IS5 family transposase